MPPVISPPTVISPLPAFSIKAIFEAFILAFVVKEPPLFVFVIETVGASNVPPVIFILPPSFITEITPSLTISPDSFSTNSPALTLLSIVIPFLPAF